MPRATPQPEDVSSYRKNGASEFGHFMEPIPSLTFPCHQEKKNYGATARQPPIACADHNADEDAVIANSRRNDSNTKITEINCFWCPQTGRFCVRIPGLITPVRRADLMAAYG